MSKLSLITLVAAASMPVSGDIHYPDTGFLGMELSGANLVHLGERHYSPSLGRFTTADKAKALFSGYVYTKGNPIAYSDPTGLMPGRQIVTELIEEIDSEREPMLISVTKESVRPIVMDFDSMWESKRVQPKYAPQMNIKPQAIARQTFHDYYEPLTPKKEPEIVSDEFIKKTDDSRKEFIQTRALGDSLKFKKVERPGQHSEQWVEWMETSPRDSIAQDEAIKAEHEKKINLYTAATIGVGIVGSAGLMGYIAYKVSN